MPTNLLFSIQKGKVIFLLKCFISTMAICTNGANGSAVFSISLLKKL